MKNLFGNMRNRSNFAVFTDNGYIHFAEQAVKLLIYYMGIFYAHTLGYWRLPIRKIIKALGVETISVNSVYGSRFFCLPITYF